MGRHSATFGQRTGRKVRRFGKIIVRTFAALGAAFLGLFVYFLVAVDTPSTPTTQTHTPAAHEVIVSTGISPTGNGVMELRQDGTVRVTGDCIPDDDDFFWPCADVSNTTIDDTRVAEDDPRWDCRTMGNRVCGEDEK